jgi:hypothetical protein
MEVTLNASLGIVPSVYSLISTKHKLCQSLFHPGAPLVGCSVGRSLRPASSRDLPRNLVAFEGIPARESWNIRRM